MVHAPRVSSFHTSKVQLAQCGLETYGNLDLGGGSRPPIRPLTVPQFLYVLGSAIPGHGAPTRQPPLSTAAPRRIKTFIRGICSFVQYATGLWWAKTLGRPGVSPAWACGTWEVTPAGTSCRMLTASAGICVMTTTLPAHPALMLLPICSSPVGRCCRGTTTN